APASVIGQALSLREGADLCLLGTGVMAATAVEVASILSGRAAEASVYSIPTIKPLDHGFLAQVFARFPLVASIEEHGLIGGFGAAIAEWMADQVEPPRARLLRFGAEDRFMHVAGETEYAQEYFGLAAGQIAEKIALRLGAREVARMK